MKDNYNDAGSYTPMIEAIKQTGEYAIWKDGKSIGQSITFLLYDRVALILGVKFGQRIHTGSGWKDG